jgi:AcrR family transcriptional regulator
MSPRPYQAGQRRLAATAATRKKIVEAARALLADPEAGAFSIDAVAERADVARMTVYYQYKSKAKLLEALFDDLGERADMRRMRKVFEERDARKSLGLLVDVFCHLWETQGSILRRLTAIAALDPEVDRALEERGDWRREALTNLIGRLPKRKRAEELVEVLHALTSFDVYETLRRAKRSSEVSASLKRAVEALVESY